MIFYRVNYDQDYFHKYENEKPITSNFGMQVDMDKEIAKTTPKIMWGVLTPKSKSNEYFTILAKTNVRRITTNWQVKEQR